MKGTMFYFNKLEKQDSKKLVEDKEFVKTMSVKHSDQPYASRITTNLELIVLSIYDNSIDTLWCEFTNIWIR